jgi:glycosyltransferase involved in cell wall biosynthesis
MLNIISDSILSIKTSGPKKVVENLIKGLDKIGFPYVINKKLDSCGLLWIQDNTEALWEIKTLPKNIRILIGPNLFTVPRQIPAGLDLSRAVYIQPSNWTKNFWQHFGLNQYKIEVWPTGIDTEKFMPLSGSQNFVLVYFKDRDRDDLKYVYEILIKKGFDFNIIEYPHYKEKKYLKALRQAKYVIWLGRQESQGIALQEAMSCNVPILLCDVNRVGQVDPVLEDALVFNQEEKNYQNTTSAEYFDNRCGIKIHNLAELEKAIDFMEENFRKLEPRKYVLAHLSLEKQAQEFIDIYRKTWGDILPEKFKASWKIPAYKNATFCRKAYIKMRDIHASLKKTLSYSRKK